MSLSSELRRVLGLAWPVMLSMLSYSFMSAADAVFVGRLGTVPLAAIGLGVTGSFLFLALPMGLVRGVRVAVAQATGGGRHADVDRLGWQAVWLALACGAVVAAAGSLGPLAFQLLDSSAATREEALGYFMIRVRAAPVALLGMGLTAWFEGRGDTRTPMIANVTANLLCIALDAVLVPGLGPIPAFGIRGAAWAGVIALGVAAIGLTIAAVPKLRGIPAALDQRLLREALRLGLPIGTQRILEVLSWSVLTGALAGAGDAQLAAHVLAIRVLMLSFLPGLAIGEATAVLVGQAVGAEDQAQARRSWRAGTVAAFGVMSLGGLFFVLTPGLLLAPFHPAADVVPVATKLLAVAALFQLFDAIATVTYFSLDGAGDTRFTLAASLSVSWLVKLPLGVGLVRYAGYGALGAWIGLTLETIFLMGLLLWRWHSGGWYRVAPRVGAAPAAPTPAPVAALYEDDPPSEEVLA